MSLWNVIGAVLYLGNIQFEAPSDNSEASLITASSRDSLLQAVNLLNVAEDLLESALTVRTITARTETYK